MAEEIKQGLTRREVLKKGAVVGGTLGAVMWVAPVVRASEITDGAAAIPSEGTCCLRVQIVSAEVGDFSDPGTELNDVKAVYRGINCGPESITDVNLKLEQSSDSGSNWISVSTSYNGNVAPGADTGLTTVITDLDAGSYLYRLSGTYKCALGGDATLTHNIPLPYDFAGPLVIS